MKAKSTATRAKAAPIKSTRTAKPVSPPAKPARKVSAAAKARPAAKPVAPVGRSGRSSHSTSDLLRAGLNALSLPRAESAVADGLSKIADSFGLKKLEDVFDHRVAAAMERIGYPSAKELRALSTQVTELVALLKSQKNRS